MTRGPCRTSACKRRRSVARAAGGGGGWYPRVAVWLGGWRGMALVPGVGGMRHSAGRPGSGALYPGRDMLPPPNNALEPTAPMVAFTHAAVSTWRGGSPRAFGISDRGEL